VALASRYSFHDFAEFFCASNFFVVHLNQFNICFGEKSRARPKIGRFAWANKISLSSATRGGKSWIEI